MMTNNKQWLVFYVASKSIW